MVDTLLTFLNQLEVAMNNIVCKKQIVIVIIVVHCLFYTCYIYYIYFFITLLNELLFIYKKTNIYNNAMIVEFKIQMQSNESPIRTKWICKYM